MATDDEDPLFARADMAIADAVATRIKVRAGLIAAWDKRRYRPGPHACPAPPVMLQPMNLEALEPWWSVARTLASAGEVIRAADAELEHRWQRLLPTIETPLGLVRR